MAQDIDVARVAAALRAPVIRYRNFGNVPVRGVAPPVEEASEPVSAPLPLPASPLDIALAEAAALQAEEAAKGPVSTPELESAPQPPVDFSVEETVPAEMPAPPLGMPHPAVVDSVPPASAPLPARAPGPLAVPARASAPPPTPRSAPPVASAAPVAVPLAGPVAAVPASAPVPPLSRPREEGPLLAVLQAAAAQPAPQEGLLGLLSRPAAWAPGGSAEAPLRGMPIAPPDPQAGGLLSSTLGVPGPLTAVAEPVPLSRPEEAAMASQPAPLPPRLPRGEARPAPPAAATVPPPARPTAEQPSLAQVFRAVRARPQPAPAAKPDVALRQVLRGLRAGRMD